MIAPRSALEKEDEKIGARAVLQIELPADGVRNQENEQRNYKIFSNDFKVRRQDNLDLQTIEFSVG